MLVASWHSQPSSEMSFTNSGRRATYLSDEWKSTVAGGKGVNSTVARPKAFQEGVKVRTTINEDKVIIALQLINHIFFQDSMDVLTR